MSRMKTDFHGFFDYYLSVPFVSSPGYCGTGCAKPQDADGQDENGFSLILSI